MLFSTYREGDTHFLCPYCGRRIALFDEEATVDHVIPRSEWRHMKRTVAYTTLTESVMLDTVNDKRNKIWACRKCNTNKDSVVYVPNWETGSRFRFWEVEDLKQYSDYFYFWRSCIYEELNHCIHLSTQLSEFRDYCEKTIAKLDKFVQDYESRVVTNHWYIDEVTQQ